MTFEAVEGTTTLPFHSPLTEHICKILRIKNLRDIKEGSGFTVCECFSKDSFRSHYVFFKGVTHDHFPKENQNNHPDETIIIALSANRRIEINRYEDGRPIECLFIDFHYEGGDDEVVQATVFFGDNIMLSEHGLLK